MFVTVKKNVKSFFQILGQVFRLMWNEKRWPTEFIANFLQKAPVGHAAADVFPDQPYLIWQYSDFKNQLVKRDNPVIFMQAMEMMVRAMQAWRAGDLMMSLETQPGLNQADRDVIANLFRESVGIDGEERRQDWLETIGRGEFSFGSELPSYIGKGAGSWKDCALGTVMVTDSGFERFQYAETFLTSDWKLFHDALQIHRSDVLHEILPRYGICAA